MGSALVRSTSHVMHMRLLRLLMWIVQLLSAHQSSEADVETQYLLVNLTCYLVYECHSELRSGEESLEPYRHKCFARQTETHYGRIYVQGIPHCGAAPRSE
jgi:hypothetical protein